MQNTNNQKIIIFDLDDTLIPNNIYYLQAKQKVAKVFKELFGENINEQELIEEYSLTDLNKIKRLGLSRSRFSLTAVELYIKYCTQFHKEIVTEELDRVFITANTVFDTVEQISEEVINVMDTLSKKGHKIYILTSGDDIIQTFKVYKSKLYQIIDNDNIIVVPEKNNAIYEKLFIKYGFENCCMIGNSSKRDINPALNAGMFAIHIPAGTWEYEYETLKDSDKLYIVDSLSCVIGIIEKIFEN